MTPQDFYERECELLDRQLEAGQISKAEHLDSTRRLRKHLAMAMQGQSAESRERERVLTAERDQLRNILDAGKGQSGASILYELLDQIRNKLKEIVVTEGCDRGVVLLSSDGPTHYDEVTDCQVYEHENFSPLGDALIELWELCLQGENARLRPPHQCRCIARIHNMAAGRDWWLGELLERVPEWPHETHCLHIKTPLKSVVFLCNMGDLQGLAVLCDIPFPIKNPTWKERMEAAYRRAATA